MAAQRKQPFVTPEEYLALERAAEEKSEYYAGEMVAMSGASLRHEAIVMNLGAELRDALRGKPCRPYASNLRVRVRSTNYFYPDVSVVCGKPELLDDAYLDTLLNPKVVFEILSESTESRDRGIKWRLYQHIESLEQYVLIDQNLPIVEVYTRQSADSWVLHTYTGLEVQVPLPSIDVTLALSDLYEGVELPPDAPAD